MLDVSLATSGLVFLVTLFLMWLAFTVSRRQNEPPGPFPLPVVGNVLLMRIAGTDILDTLRRFARQYGPIFSLKLGQMNLVFISDAKILQESFVKQASDFSDRPRDVLPILKFLDEKVGSGVILSNGVAWQELRRVSLTAMRELGVGKKSLEEKVMEETSVILEQLSRLEGAPYHMKPILSKATSNVICNVIFGTRFEHDDKTFEKLLFHIQNAFRVNPLFQTINFFPFLRHIPGFMQVPNMFLKTFMETDEYVKELMKGHEATYDPDNIRDFVDLLIEVRTQNKGNRHFTATNMRRVIVDLFTAGSDTTANALYWAMLLMAAHPEVQRRCHEEIDSVVGRSRQVTIADKAQLKYIEATILEVLRMGIIAPFTVPHCAARDTSIRGYHIPKDTVIIGTIFHMNRDPTQFPEPDKFKPERFLDDKGNLINRDRVVSFSAGPRSCLGEILAKMELNLIFPSILQRYTICPVAPDQPVNLDLSVGLTVQGKEQNLVFKKR